jgi:hypothetical protein
MLIHGHLSLETAKRILAQEQGGHMQGQGGPLMFRGGPSPLLCSAVLRVGVLKILMNFVNKYANLRSLL